MLRVDHSIVRARNSDWLLAVEIDELAVFLTEQREQGDLISADALYKLDDIQLRLKVVLIVGQYAPMSPTLPAARET